jgi:hypothetical protein
MLNIKWRRSLCAAAMLWAFLGANVQAQEPVAAPSVKMIDLDGHAVRVQLIGLDKRQEGTPVVVFEAGATNPLEIWGGILPQLAAITPSSHTIAQVSDDLSGTRRGLRRSTLRTGFVGY